MGPEQDPVVADPPTEEMRSTSEIKSDIRRTRDRLDVTLEHLNERLSPRSIINDVLSWFESQADNASSGAADSLKRGGRGVIRQIRNNPIPTVLVGAGVAWFILSGDDEDGSVRQDQAVDESESRVYPTAAGGEFRAYGQRKEGGLGSVIKDKAGQAQEAVSGAVGTATEKMSDIGTDLQARVSSTGTMVSEGVHQGRRAGIDAMQQLQKSSAYLGDRFQEAVDEYPLTVAAGFLGIGLLAGLLLPRTRQEDKLLGKQSDQLVEKAKETGKEVLDKTKTVAERVTQSTLEEAKRQGLTLEAAAHNISETGGKVGSISSQAKEEAIHAATEELNPTAEKKEEPEKPTE